ncbi:unnamed protein product, partial [Prorocentrum cordatum]
ALQAQVLVEVDDWAIAFREGGGDNYLKPFQARFTFGRMKKLDAAGVEYIGRRLRLDGDRVLVDQEKYILEQLQKIPLARGRRGNHEDSLVGGEVAAFRSLVYKLQWVGRETRAEAAGTASILAAKVNGPSVKDLLDANKMVDHLRFLPDGFVLAT